MGDERKSERTRSSGLIPQAAPPPPTFTPSSFSSFCHFTLPPHSRWLLPENRWIPSWRQEGCGGESCRSAGLEPHAGTARLCKSTQPQRGGGQWWFYSDWMIVGLFVSGIGCCLCSSESEGRLTVVCCCCGFGFIGFVLYNMYADLEKSNLITCFLSVFNEAAFILMQIYLGVLVLKIKLFPSLNINKLLISSVWGLDRWTITHYNVYISRYTFFISDSINYVFIVEVITGDKYCVLLKILKGPGSPPALSL